MTTNSAISRRYFLRTSLLAGAATAFSSLPAHANLFNKKPLENLKQVNLTTGEIKQFIMPQNKYVLALFFTAQDYLSDCGSIIGLAEIAAQDHNGSILPVIVMPKKRHQLDPKNSTNQYSVAATSHVQLLSGDFGDVISAAKHYRAPYTISGGKVTNHSSAAQLIHPNGNLIESNNIADLVLSSIPQYLERCNSPQHRADLCLDR